VVRLKEDARRMSPSAIPFNRPGHVGKEISYIAKAIANGHISGDGAFTKACHALLSELHGGAPVLLTTSCTHALELAALLLDLKEGDEVIVPSFTFVSTANAFAVHGARLIFCDVRPDTLNLDEEALAALVGPRTRAIVPVHYAGIGCAMERILEAAAGNGAVVIEDNAHGFLGRWRGTRLGTFGALATLSFHETKNFTCGEGGALVINDRRFAERAEIIREKGTNRSRFFRGEVDKYSWVDLGSSYLPSDLLSAYLLAQLEARDEILAARRRVCARYRDGLTDWAAANGVGLPFVPPEAEPSYHMFYVLLPSHSAQGMFLRHMRARAIQCVFHYVPLHSSAAGRRFGSAPGGCPVTDRVSERIVRLPLFNDLTEPDQQRVIEAVCEFIP
jgi:dTDP-4-amino-4,6-dideoxygalactose transaminase